MPALDLMYTPAMSVEARNNPTRKDINDALDNKTLGIVRGLNGAIKYYSNLGVVFSALGFLEGGPCRRESSNSKRSFSYWHNELMSKELILDFEEGRIDEQVVRYQEGERLVFTPPDAFVFYDGRFRGSEGTICDTVLFLSAAVSRLYEHGSSLVTEKRIGVAKIIH